MHDKLLILLIILSAFTACVNEQADPIDPVTGLDTTIQLVPKDAENPLLIPYRNGNKWGYADTTMKVVINPVFDYAAPFSEALGRVAKLKDSTWYYGFINKEGREVIPLNFTFASDRVCGFIALQVDSGIVIIDHLARRISSDFYEATFRHFCSEGFIPVMKNKKIAILNSRGQYITDFLYSSIYRFQNGLCPVAVNNQWGVIDTTGKEVVQMEYSGIFPYNNGLAVSNKKVKNNFGRNVWGVIDQNGNHVVPFIYDYFVGGFKGDIGIAQNNKWNNEQVISFIYDRNGNKLDSNHIDYQEEFNEGLAVFKQDGKFGFIDTSGKVVIPPQYEWACGFTQEVAWVQSNGKYGFIDRNNRIFVPIEYNSGFDYVHMQECGVQVMKDGVEGLFYIDKSGREYLVVE